jgi:hypothetical protein
MKAKQSLSSIKGHGAGLAALAVTAFVGLNPGSALASDWSDTSIGWRYGTAFGEPYVYNGNITKNIVDFQHVDGYKYGTNFFNIDLLMSNDKDPDATGGGAQEAYVVYRHTLELSKITGGDYKIGGITRDFGAEFGFDWNTKNDAGYQSKKRMFVLGPKVEFDVPGFFNASILELWESNEPIGLSSRYEYKTHPMLSTNWGIPIGSSPFSYEGFFLLIAPKGTNEFGGSTVTETNFDSEIMLDVGRVMGGPKGTFKVGFEYQYWKNKFGNDHNGPAGSGAFAKTPMIRAEYHF